MTILKVSLQKRPFDCGVSSINEYVKNSYFPTITQHAYAYSIMHGDVVLGYYQVLFREIEMTDFPDDISECDPGIREKISSVHIRFIAVDRGYQNHHIGTSTLKTIIKDVKEFAAHWPIRIITIDAENHLIDWYESIGFIKMRRNTESQDGYTEAMYFDCLNSVDELEDYLNDMWE